MKSLGRIKAVFELDDDGKPIYVQGKRLRHYKIKLSAEGMPDPVAAVTFKLHESYRDPVREVFKGSESDAPFTETITSYGDFEVAVSPSGQFSSESSSGLVCDTIQRLSDALHESARTLDGDAQSIDDALRDIRSH